MGIDKTLPDKVFDNRKRVANEFAEIALRIRRDIIKSLYFAGSGHSGGSLGTTDILTVLYFGGFMQYDPSEPEWKERDRFILSAGHICPVLYSVLARARVFSGCRIIDFKEIWKQASRVIRGWI